jgi:pimeloyl-ACP methyl ester carboxylesterase
VLLDPAIQILPHVGIDFAVDAARQRTFADEDEAIAARLASGAPTPREFVEEEAREHLEPAENGGLRWRYCNAAGVTAYSEMCTDPPPPSVLQVPTLLVHASYFGLVRPEQLEEYEAELGDRLEAVAVPGGHVVYWDAYEQTADALEKFLIRHEDVTHA